ncbi:hypothetical protein GCM10018779_32270 [Streptomyces griseocarneus]|nr:hypothetical protein GCM10018779_32270 [Streptomyces griseocarneus]
MPGVAVLGLMRRADTVQKGGKCRGFERRSAALGEFVDEGAKTTQPKARWA